MCRLCATRLQEDRSEHSHERKSLLRAYLDLVVAIRDSAIASDDLDSWESYWLAEPWASLWEALHDSEQERFSSKNSSRIFG